MEHTNKLNGMLCLLKNTLLSRTTFAILAAFYSWISFQDAPGLCVIAGCTWLVYLMYYHVHVTNGICKELFWFLCCITILSIIVNILIGIGVSGVIALIALAGILCVWKFS